MSSSPYRTTQFPQGGGSNQASGRGGDFAKIVMGVGCGCGSLVALIFFLFFVWLATLPEGGALPGGQMPPESVEHLLERGLIEQGERVVYYYDYTMRMNGDEACFFTDRRIVYHRGDQVNAVDWDEVEDIQGWEDLGQVFEVQSVDGRYLRCEIAALNDGEAFYRALLDTWSKRGG